MAVNADDVVVEVLEQDVPFTAEILSEDVSRFTAKYLRNKCDDSDMVEFELQDVIENYRKANKLCILVGGKTGTGKSTLANGILGAQVAKISAGVLSEGMTTEVEHHCKTIGGLKLTVIDSPGLQDGTSSDEEYLEMIAKGCSERDIVLYCISMAGNRCVKNNMDIRAMKKFTEKFGSEFWSNAVIALTYANAAVDTYMKYLPEAERRERFTTLVAQWDKLIKKALYEEVDVSQEVINNIKIVPAGHASERSLPDRPYWLSDLWVECLDVIPTVEGRAAGQFCEITKSRSSH